LTRYKKSEEHLKRAENTIPLGSQTFSKSRTQYPVGVSPLYAKKASGCHLWDLDGNKYIDLVSSLASVTIGYNNKKINFAVKKQLLRGVSFSLPGALEADVAELICELVPSAEMVRFGKNGTDATSAAVRLARAYTGRDHVAVCGYHGWQDWFVGSTTRNKGVPRAVSELTHSFSYNDLQSLQRIFESNQDIACVVMEPMNSVSPEPGFLEGVQELTRKFNAILIFDETITGFRFSAGGAQELFGITPDLSTFGKGIANGFPLSAVVGKREIMMEMENVFISGTFGGELLSLSAAHAVLNLHKKRNVSSELAEIGSSLREKIEETIKDVQLSEVLHFSGHPSWNFLNWTPTSEFSVEEIKTYFHQEIYRLGVLVLNTHNVNLAFSTRDVARASDAYASTLSKISTQIQKGTLRDSLEVEPLVPLFRVR
jgi:glutamate-1-semialdehyde 2,1-aminomutase